MEKDNRETLEQRISHLEKEVRDLRRLLEGRETDDSITISASGEDSSGGFSEAGEEKAFVGSPSFADKIRVGENWLQRIGIALLLLGVAFLFKYSIDQGWLVPPIRSLIGLGIGLALFVTGLQLSDDSSPLKQICLGGGIGVFYITGFATFQLYSFAPSGVVWVFMIVVTLLSLSLSWQQDQPVLSVVGTLGGLGTPFMLYTGEGSLSSLIIYTTVILSAASAMYFKKGWKSLLWTMVAGGWLVLLVGFYNNIVDVINPVVEDQVSLQAGIVICMVVFWIVPVFREVMTNRNPQKWPDPSFQNEDGSVDENAFYLSNPSVQLMALVVPLFGVLYSMGIWDLSTEAWGVIAMAFALVVGYAYLPLRKENLSKLSSIHGFSALVLLTVAFFLLLEGDLLFTVLALEGLGLRILAQRNDDEQLSVSSHILFGIVGVWLAERFTGYHAPEWAILNLDALTQLLIIGIAGLAVPNWLNRRSSRQMYRLVAHIALLAWFYSEFAALENGQAYVSVCWGIYAIGLLIFGLNRQLDDLRLAAMGTIFLVVGKLFLIDLSQLQAIWRILLFIGFGAVFLMISYIVQKKFLGDENVEKINYE